jgi:DNA polymerase-3 subunit delta
VNDVLYLVKGNDPLLRAAALDALVAELLGDDDRSLALEEFTVPGRGDADDGGSAGGADVREAIVGAVLNAAASPPFMTARRVVVVRDAGALTAADADRLGVALEAPLETTVLVFVVGGGTLPAALAKKLKDAGARERAPESEKTSDVLADAAAAQDLRLRPEAVKLVSSHFGEDAGRVASLVDALHAAYGDDATLSADDVAPYLGEAGAVPTYQLTNAIEAGDEAAALDVLHRLLTASSAQQPRPMHPLQVLGSLNGHYRRMLRLDDPAVQTPAEAVAALGGRVKEYPARKALDGARALGTTGLRQAFDALYQADLDLKGARGIPPDAVVEVLVVRLARLTRAGGRRGPTRRR